MAAALVLPGKKSMKLIHEASSIEIFVLAGTVGARCCGAGAGEVSEDRARLLEFQIGP